jgi:site-specific DNA-methyltransferase (adenine-specific)
MTLGPSDRFTYVGADGQRVEGVVASSPKPGDLLVRLERVGGRCLKLPVEAYWPKGEWQPGLEVPGAEPVAEALPEPRAQVVAGCCLTHLRTLPDASVDSCVTDPPAGIAFMGQEWDGDKGGRDQWIAWMQEIAAEVLRVLKPGAHAFVWALPRTSHWTATAWENAGFEVRDRTAHVFATGFPKSHNVSKALDAAAGVERAVVGQLPQTGAKFKLTQETIDNGGYNDPERESYDVTAPATELAQQWDGWGTAQKPAVEDWWLFRKPLIGTVAENVTRFGTGALNIDGCRVGTADNLNGGAYAKLGTERHDGDASWRYKRDGGAGEFSQPKGRWPANFVISHDPACGEQCVPGCPALLLDAQSGETASREGKSRTSSRPGLGYGMTHTGAEYSDRGGASRFFANFDAEPFFFCAKPGQSERDMGCDQLPEQQIVQFQTANGTSGKASSISEGRDTRRRNIHPTVKPARLMAYLCRLITPPDGLVLDPFCGSGSTGVGALREGFRFLGLELNPEYAEIAQARLAHVQPEIAPLSATAPRPAPVKTTPQLGLF